jgi:hypothetical protein
MQVRQPHAGRFVGGALLNGLYNVVAKTGADQTITAGAGYTAITNLVPAVTIDPLDRAGVIIVAQINYWAAVATAELDIQIDVNGTVSAGNHVGPMAAATEQYSITEMAYFSAATVGTGAITWSVEAQATTQNVVIYADETKLFYAFISELR